MKKTYSLSIRSLFIIRFCMAIFCLSMFTNNLMAQCSGTSPVFNVDLSANPDTVYTISSTRNGSACSGTTCIRFMVTLSTRADLINFNVTNPAPSGGPVYQIDCGAMISLNTPSCTGGAGSLCIAYCKAGGDNPTYTITTSKSHNVTPITNATIGCSKSLTATGYNTGSITWQSVYPGGPGTYNSYLSCTSGCGTTNVTPSSGAPSLIKYLVSGNPSTSCPGTVLDTAYVYVSSAISPSISTTNVTCFADSNGTANASATGGAAPYTYSWSHGQTIQNITGLYPDNYVVTVADNNGCTASTNAMITQPSQLTINAGSDQSICSGASAFLNASSSGGIGGNTYSWSSPGTLSNSSAINPTATPVSTTAYTVTVTDANACVANDQVTVTIIANPNVTATSSGDVCIGNSTALTAGGATNYSWTPSTGLDNPNIASPSASPSVTTTYTVTGVTGACSATSNITVNVNPLPNANAGTDVNICENGTAGLAGSGGIIYNWTPGTSLDDPSSSTPSATPSSTTTYTLNVTDVNGCSAVDQITVNVLPNPNVTASSNVNICPGSTTAISAAGASSYSWSPTTGLSSPGSNLTNAAPFSTTTYTVTGTTGACSSTANVTVYIFAPTSAGAGADLNMCEGGSATLNGNGGVIYSWTPAGDLTDPNIANPTAMPTVTTVYTLNVTDTNGCVVTDQMTVNVLPNPNVTAGSSGDICPGNSTSLSASGAASYSWSPSTGLSNQNISNPTASPGITTAYTVTGVTGGCSGTANITVFVYAPPIANAGSDASICQGGSAVLNGSGGMAYDWSPTTDLSSTNISNPISTPTSTISYTLTVTDSNNCTGTDQITVNVIPNPNVSAASGGDICPGNSTMLTAVGATSYIWTPSTGLSSPNTDTSTAAPGVTTNYTVTGTTGVCSATANVTITVYALPIANAGTDMSFCQGGNVTLSGSGGVSYNWTGPGLNNNTIANPTASPLTTTSYSLQVTDANGCSNSDTIIVTVIANPVISGTVNFLGVPVNGGSIAAYLIDSLNAFSFVGSANINGSGDYIYSFLGVGNYYLKATLDTAAYTGAISTYSSSYFAWANANIISASCGGSSVANIDVIQTPQLTGTGVISGQIFGGNGPLKTWQQGDPIPGVDVSLEQNPGSVMLAQTTTDAAGAYAFINVPDGNYAIYVDVPGLGMSATYSVTISPSNNTFDNAMFYVDSTGTIDTVRAVISGIRSNTKLINPVSVFPNPFNTYTNINYELSERSNVNIDVYNVLGEKVATLVNTNKDKGKYTEKFSAKNYNSTAGIYFVKVVINGNTQTIKLLEIN